MLFCNSVGELRKLGVRKLASMNFPLLFSNGEQGWHLEFRYQSYATSLTTIEFHAVILLNTDSASSPMGTHCSIALQD